MFGGTALGDGLKFAEQNLSLANHSMPRMAACARGTDGSQPRRCKERTL